MGKAAGPLILECRPGSLLPISDESRDGRKAHRTGLSPLRVLGRPNSKMAILEETAACRSWFLQRAAVYRHQSKANSHCSVITTSILSSPRKVLPLRFRRVPYLRRTCISLRILPCLPRLAFSASLYQGRGGAWQRPCIFEPINVVWKLLMQRDDAHGRHIWDPDSCSVERRDRLASFIPGPLASQKIDCTSI